MSKMKIQEKYKNVFDIRELVNFLECPFEQPVKCPADMHCEDCIIKNLSDDRKIMIEVKIYDKYEIVQFIPESILLRMNVRYIETDFEYSQQYIYEDNIDGTFYAAMS